MVGPLLLFVNEIDKDIESTINIYTEDRKLYRKIISSTDAIIFQTDIERLTTNLKASQRQSATETKESHLLHERQ